MKVGAPIRNKYINLEISSFTYIYTFIYTNTRNKDHVNTRKNFVDRRIYTFLEVKKRETGNRR